jgi:hypothetical protein
MYYFRNVLAKKLSINTLHQNENTDKLKPSTSSRQFSTSPIHKNTFQNSVYILYASEPDSVISPSKLKTIAYGNSERETTITLEDREKLTPVWHE